MEQWNKIPGYSKYQASRSGFIKTFNWKNKGIEKIMSPALDNCGYLRTMLKSDDGKYNTIKVHRIIAQTFLSNPSNKPCVNHINGIKTDNRVDNLEWCTQSENLKHAYKNNFHSVKGERNPSTSLKDFQVNEIRKKYTYGRKGGKPNKGDVTKKMLAKEYNVGISVIKRIVTNKSWRHLL